MTGKMYHAYKPGRGTTLFVAASNANALSKFMADYICDGTADQVEINAALAALPTTFGKVLLSEGQFNLAAPISFTRTNSELSGMGWGTILRVIDAGGAPINITIVNVNQANCLVHNFKLDGNKANNAGATSMIGVGLLANNCILENVWVVNSKAYGIYTDNGSSGHLVQSCISEGSDTSNYLLRSGTTNVGRIISCISKTGAAGYSFDLGSYNVVSCLAHGSSGTGFLVSSADTSLVGCVSEGNTGLGVSIGAARCKIMSCDVRNNAGGGISTSGSGTFVSILGNSIYLNTSGSGIDINTTDCAVKGNTVTQNAQHGIRVAGARTGVIGNKIIDNGTQTATTYSGILLSADDCYIDSNLIRKGSAAANKHMLGIQITGGSNSYIGINDLYDSGTTGEITDAGTNTRRVSKIQLDQTFSSDLMNAAAVTAATQTDVCTNQTFRVDSATSVIGISVKGAMLLGNCAAVAEAGSRIVVDSAGTPINKKIGGSHLPVAAQYCNPFAGGGGTVWFTGLAIGNHTVKVQIIITQNATAYLRASSVPDEEHLNIQVLEYQR